MAIARAALVRACSDKDPPRGPPQSFREFHGSATITGALFFDFSHHQRGKVPNGTASFYHGDDPTCTRHEIPTGSSLFEPAGNVHIVRNEGSVPLVNVVVQLLPTGAPRLISEPNPRNCPF